MFSWFWGWGFQTFARHYVFNCFSFLIPIASLGCLFSFSGIREFCCKLCNYKGVTQSDLNRHMKSQIHMLKSRNECPHCGEGFVTPKNLDKHVEGGNCLAKRSKVEQQWMILVSNDFRVPHSIETKWLKHICMVVSLFILLCQILHISYPTPLPLGWLELLT